MTERELKVKALAEEIVRTLDDATVTVRGIVRRVKYTASGLTPMVLDDIVLVTIFTGTESPTFRFAKPAGPFVVGDMVELVVDPDTPNDKLVSFKTVD